MKRLIILILILATWVGIPLAKNQSTVLIVKAEASSSLGSYTAYNDNSRRKMAQIYRICKQRNIDTRTYYWNGYADRLKGFIREVKPDFTVFVGGGSWNIGSYVKQDGSDNLGYFWSRDTSYCNTDAFVWFERADIYSGDVYDSGVTGARATKGSKKFYCYTANYSGALDTLAIYGPNSSTSSYFVAVDPAESGIDSILTYAGYYTAGDEHHLGLWSRSDNGVTRYYSAIADGGLGMAIDAIICKHVPYFRKLQYAFDIDDFGMHSGGTGWTTFPNATVRLTHDNFFSHIDTLFQSIIEYDMRLSVGIVTDDLRNSAAYADSNQWAEWYALAQKYKDDSHFQWSWHNHGLENPNDQVSATFYSLNSFTDSPYDSGNLPTVVYIDSVYQSDCDSIRAWGLNVANYLIPPTDDLAGYYGTMKDTIAEFLKLNNLCSADKILTFSYDEIYSDYTKLDNDSRIYLRYYISIGDTSDVTISEKSEDLFKKFWGSTFSGWSLNDGLNPNTDKVGTWHFSGRALAAKEYSDPIAKIGVMHVWSCYDDGVLNYNEQTITHIGKTIEYLEWLAGKDIYECVFAQDIDWEQVR